MNNVVIENLFLGNVFGLIMPLEQEVEVYRAMDERRAIKTLLRP